MTKECRKCNVVKSIECFYPHAGCVGGRRHECVECRKEDMKIYNASIVEKARWAWIKRAYGLDRAEWEALMRAQFRACKVCKIPFGMMATKYIHVDHCHTTGRVRGLLCLDCNRLLGAASDDTRVLESAIRYLRRG